MSELCPVCTEEMCETDKLECGHQLHPRCVKKAADALQEQRADLGYPSLQYARCPLCRADLLNIPVKPAPWFGEITLNTAQVSTLLQILESGCGIIDMDTVPSFISDQMPDAYPEEQHRFANKAATILWLTKDMSTPSEVIVRQIKDGRQGRFGHKVIF